MATGMKCPACGAALLTNATCAQCGGEAVEPTRAAAMRDALGADLFKNIPGMQRHCPFCDAVMMRQQAKTIVIDVCTGCSAWFLDRDERERLGQLAELKARGVDLTPPPPKPVPMKLPETPPWKLGLQVMAGLAFASLVLFTVVMTAWGAMNRDPDAGKCKTHCDCGGGGGGDTICVGGSCTTVYCKTGFFSTRDCQQGFRCVKTTRWKSESDRKRYNGVCRPDPRPDCARK